MTSDLPRVTVRMNKEDIKKLKYIAQHHYRTMNAEIVWILLGYIRAFEAKNGNIKFED